MSPSVARERTLEALSSSDFDLLVVGAGIVGSRVALEARKVGLRVALVEAGDFAGGTSSASSKLVHGGLRYLAEGHLTLVRTSRLEQQALRTRIAPHLVQEFPFVLAIDRDARFGRHAVTAGMAAYEALSGFRAHGGRLDLAAAGSLVPPLVPERLVGCALFTEAQTNDARLTLATVRAAADAGTVVCNYARTVSLERTNARISGALIEGRPGEGVLEIRCRAVVGAVGPWVDELRRLEDARSRPIVRLSKGVHAVFPRPDGWTAGLAISLADSKVVFAVPWNDVLLVGVTDTPYEEDPSEVAVEAGDLESLLDPLAPYLPAGLLRPDRMLTSFAGLRALPRGEGDTTKARRDHVVSVGPGGLVSVAGGKLTTHRVIARDVMRELPAAVRPRKIVVSAAPLPGAAATPSRELFRRAGAETARHLVSVYGGEAAGLVRFSDRPNAFERLHPDAPDVWAQVDHAAEREWALTPMDVARRRTTLALRGLADDTVLTAIQQRLTEAAAAR
jgi:glycerol-3-phosphate dehydrogenase